jgi:Holliday junction DNA helicase RuvA
MFELLLTVSGVGPKSALNILSAANLDNLRQAIVMNDHTLLTKISGIGAKTAEKIVVELKSKLGTLALGSSNVSVNSDELDALVGLGYSLGLARQALGQVDQMVTDSGERIRAALKILGK